MMKPEHIINILDERALTDLSDPERAAIETHCKECSACWQAYQAAVITASLLQERAAEAIEPTPFFKTRVMVALRERQAESLFNFAALWRAARAMVASMITVVVILMALNFYLGSYRTSIGSDQTAANDMIYSTESVILGNSDLSDDLTDNEVLTTIYDSSRSNGEYK